MRTKNRSIAIPLFRRTHIITQDFFLGLFCALLFHLLLLGLFRVTPLHTPDEVPPLPFTEVEAVVTPPSRKTLPMKSLILPLFSKKVPTFKELPFPTDPKEEERKESSCFDPDFSLIEKIPYTPPLTHDL